MNPTSPAQVPPEIPAAAARTLSEALASMRWRILEGRFALLGFPEAPSPALAARLASGAPWQILRDGGETTLLVHERDLAAAQALHPTARIQRDLVWIRFETAMDWELVGFLALVAGRLAAAGVPIGAIAGYSRDHVFLAERHLAPARAALAALFPEAGSATAGAG